MMRWCKCNRMGGISLEFENHGKGCVVFQVFKDGHGWWGLQVGALYG